MLLVVGAGIAIGVLSRQSISETRWQVRSAASRTYATNRPGPGLSLWPEAECARQDDRCRLQRLTGYPQALIDKHLAHLLVNTRQATFDRYEFLRTDAKVRAESRSLADSVVRAWEGHHAWSTRMLTDALTRQRQETLAITTLGGLGLTLAALLIIGAGTAGLYAFWCWSAAQGRIVH